MIKVSLLLDTAFSTDQYTSIGISHKLQITDALKLYFVMNIDQQIHSTSISTIPHMWLTQWEQQTA
jgi:hypothetical protein